MVTGNGPVLVVHGGAGSLPSEDVRSQYLDGVRGALDAGAPFVETDAEEAVCKAVEWLESETITNAGKGVALAADGTVSLDAGFMDGESRRYGGVTGDIRGQARPVGVASDIGPGETEPPVCGDGQCDPGESCVSCAGDCGSFDTNSCVNYRAKSQR